MLELARDPSMQPPSSADDRKASIAKIAESKSRAANLRLHLKDVIRGAAFQGSHRSGQFLEYIVEQSLAGHFDSLKERVIGMELFGRSASYDTGEDAIVRVTASDVRRRLLEHYGRYGETSVFRITLPSGSYIPDIRRKPNGAATVDERTAPHESTRSPDDSAAINPQLAALPRESVVNGSSILLVTAAPSRGFSKRIWLFAAIAVVILNLALWGVVWTRVTRTVAAPTPVLPWSALFGSSH